VVDASDNVATRYLVSDACVVANRPLVSGAALGMEGQLTVYNHSKGNCRDRATDACFQLHLLRQHANDAQTLACLESSQES